MHHKYPPVPIPGYIASDTYILSQHHTTYCITIFTFTHTHKHTCTPCKTVAVPRSVAADTNVPPLHHITYCITIYTFTIHIHIHTMQIRRYPYVGRVDKNILPFNILYNHIYIYHTHTHPYHANPMLSLGQLRQKRISCHRRPQQRHRQSALGGPRLR